MAPAGARVDLDANLPAAPALPAQLAARFPALVARAERSRPTPGQVLRLALADPAGFAVHAAVALAVRLPVLRTRAPWARGR